MTNDRQMIIFLHYWGTGPAETLAANFQSGIGRTWQTRRS
jgi:hypothetical protein